MEGLFRQLGIYASQGQLYEPVDQDQVMYYREDQKGQILEEGITEAGAISSWIAAGTAYASYGINMVPFFTFYSMFGFQRVGDLIWAAADNQARGFLIGATSGRTTLAGEGLQHCDGHSQLYAGTVPSCVAYDPTYAYELAVIVQDGMRRMFTEQENVFYYITVTNENYPMPELPAGVEEGIVRGMYLLRAAASSEKKQPRVQLLGSGAILREVLAAADLLASDFGISSDVWSVTSFSELKRQGDAAARHNMLHPEEPPNPSHVEKALSAHEGPIVAATDYVRAYADQIRAFVPRRYLVLGTDGFGRSDTRPMLRRFFEVDRHWVVVAALQALAGEGEVERSHVAAAIAKYGLDPDKRDPAKP
jgi:pyruvate dehydrogenase E1 component